MTARIAAAVAVACLLAASSTVGVALGAVGPAASVDATAETPSNATELRRAQNAGEPNDDAGNATPIEPGATASGTVASPADADVFAFDADAGRRYTATLDRAGGTGWLVLAVAGPDRGTLAYRVVPAGGSANVSVTAAASGRHYVAVASDGGTGPYALSLARSRRVEAAAERPDPDADVLGWEDGYWHDERIDVDQSDGLSPVEQRALLARTKARVEHIRHLEFTDPVSFDIVGRDALVRDAANATRPNRSDDAAVYANQVFEALFMVNESTNALDVYRNGSVAGTAAYYAAASNELVVVTPDPDRPVVDEGVLAHELVHALQDQHLTGDAWFVGLDSTDGYLGYLGLSEGDAEYVRAIYDRRCGVSWTCTGPPVGDATLASNASVGHAGISTYTYQPYADGAALVATLRDRGGWDAVNAAYGDPPETTAAVIHPESYPAGDRPELDAPAAPRAGWRVVGEDRLGEAGVFSLFWYQAVERTVGPVDPRSLYRPDAGAFDRLNYTAAPSAGWLNDSIVVYRDGDRAGYSWRIRWATDRDAREFARAYRSVLRSYDPHRRGDAWVVPGGGFADAFRVNRRGRTVTVTNAPTVDALDAIDPRGSETAAGNESRP